MADFSGATFVGMDEEMIGDGTNIAAPQGTMFLDSFAEASLRNAAYYIHEGYDVLAWTPPIGDSDVTVVTGTRPFCSNQYFTTLPPALIKVTPDMTGVELHGLYRVSDEGTSPDVYKIKIECYPLGTRKFELAHTLASTPDWQPFHETFTFSVRPPRTAWVRFAVFGRGVDVADVGTAATAGNAEPTPTKSMLIATNGGSSIFSEGTGAAPNTTSQDVRATILTDQTGTSWLSDHIHFFDPSSEDYMVINPRFDYGSGLAAQQRQMTYLQFHGVSLRPTYETEV